MTEKSKDQHKETVGDVPGTNASNANEYVSYTEELVGNVVATGGSDDDAVTELIKHISKLDNERRELQRHVERLENDKAFYKAKASSESDVAVEKDRANLRRAAGQTLAILDRLLRVEAKSLPRRRSVAGRRVERQPTSTPNIKDELLKMHRLLYMATNSVPPRRITVSAKSKAK